MYKINVQEFAINNNISLEKAHELIQPALFKQGYKWTCGNLITNKDSKHLYIEGDRLLTGNDDYAFNDDPSTLYIPSLTVEFTRQPKTVAIEGQRYLLSYILKLTPLNK